MRDLLHFIFQNITIFENPFVNIFVIAIILLTAFYSSFWIVGQLYDYGLIAGREIGSLIHWTLRFIIAFLLSVIFATIANLISIITNFISGIIN